MTMKDVASHSPSGRERRGSIFLQGLLVILIVAAGVGVAATLVKLRKPPAKKEQEVLPPLVEVMELKVQDLAMVVRGYGTVCAKVEVELIPEVAGKVVFVHPELKTGGRIAANTEIVRIDQRDYQLAVQQAQAAVAEAQVRLDTELAEADVARAEWRQLHPEVEPASALVFREPQIRRARATLESADAQLAVAKLRLSRTSLSLPFDALIVSESVDVGKFVATGQPLAVAYGIDAFEIQVPLEDEELAWFDAFDGLVAAGQESATRARIKADITTAFAGKQRRWDGYVARLAGTVDRTSRMVSIIVEAPDPLDPAPGESPLLPGTFVEVALRGRTLASAIAVPRDAIREGNTVWLVNDDQLHIRPLEIARADRGYAYVASGIDDGALIVVSSLDTVVEGMEVRTSTEGNSPRSDNEELAR